MEQGKLVIQKTSKGFSASILFDKGGVTKTLPVLSLRPKDDGLNNKPCKFKRLNGLLVHLELEDGTVLYTQNVSNQDSNAQSGKSGANADKSKDTFDLEHTRLPKDVRDLKFESIDNFYLKLNKAAYYKTHAKDRDGNEVELPVDKKKFIVAEASKSGFILKIKPSFENINFDNLVDRQRANAKKLLGEKQIFELSAQPNWKLALGMGYESVYETSITLHHIYGIPYIPASGIKGAVRSYIIATQFKNSEKDAIADKAFCDVFGCPENLDKNAPSFYNEAREGYAMFFDAFPSSEPLIEPDIMNPHYGKYYGSTGRNIKAPNDYGSLIPIHFLTVQGAKFSFVAGIRGGTNTWESPKWFKHPENSKGNMIEFIKHYLCETLLNAGIGAKTAVGYGYMDIKN